MRSGEPRPPQRDPTRLLWEADEQRDAGDYYALTRAMSRFVRQAQRTQLAEGRDIESILALFLPDLVRIMGSTCALVACQVQGSHASDTSLVVTFTHGDDRLAYGDVIVSTQEFQRVLTSREPRVLERPEQEFGQIIPGLEPLVAGRALLSSVDIGETQRLIIIYDPIDRPPKPGRFYLNTDKMALDSLVELVAIGARMGERHARQLEAMTMSLNAITETMDMDVMLPQIAQQAAKAFAADAVALFLREGEDTRYQIRGSCGLGRQYTSQRLVSAQIMQMILDSVRQGERYGYVRDLTQEPWALQELVEAENLRSVLLAPLLSAGDVIGVLAIYSKDTIREFSPYEGRLAEVFASHVSVAIKNARLYQAERRRASEAEALSEASRAIMRGFTKDLQGVLDEIVALVVKKVSDPISFVGLSLYDPITEELETVSIYPDQDTPSLRVERGVRWSVRQGGDPEHRIGVAGRAIHARFHQLVPDVNTDPDYRQSDARTQSELDLPLMDGQNQLGVLSIESDQPAAFDESDVKALYGLAELATLALRLADHRRELVRANSIAILGAWGADMAHKVNREVGAIRRSVYLLRHQHHFDEEVLRRLDAIDQAAASMSVVELPEEVTILYPGEAPKHCTWVRSIIEQMIEQMYARYPDIEISFGRDPVDACVVMHEQWLRRVLPHLLWNAAEADRPAGRPTRISVRMNVKYRFCQIEVEDNGAGVPKEMESLLFDQPISGKPGRGRGLLIADLIVRQHGGKIWLERNRLGEGACFAFTIPVA